MKTENVHLLKDVGMIPYHLFKEHGADCSIATCRNGDDYSYADNEVRGLKLDFIEPSGKGMIIDGVRYIVKNARRIDVLNTYHLNLSSYIFGLVYKILNRKGRIYLKLDMNPKGYIDCFRKNPVGIIKRATINRADVVSVETTVMLKKLRKFYGDKVLFIPNGCYAADEDDPCRMNDKKRRILTVGNLGTYEKATDVLLEAYAEYIKANPESGWELRLVGSVDESFKLYVDEYYEKYPQLKERVIFTGPIYDKKSLAAEYAGARIFTLPSLSESFGIVLVEAALRGCYLITSDKVPAGYDISHRHENGMSVKAGDVSELAAAFGKMCTDDYEWEEMGKRTAAYVKAAYDWTKIVNKLYRHLS